MLASGFGGQLYLYAPEALSLSLSLFVASIGAAPVSAEYLACLG